MQAFLIFSLPAVPNMSKTSKMALKASICHRPCRESFRTRTNNGHGSTSSLRCDWQLIRVPQRNSVITFAESVLQRALKEAVVKADISKPAVVWLTCNLLVA